MKKLYINLFLLTVLTVSAFGQDTLYFDSKWKVATADNAKYYRIDKKTNKGFERTDYFVSNNQIQMHGEFSSFNPDIREGECRWYYNNGKLMYLARYTDNKEDGTLKFYYDNGELERIENFVEGIRDGYFKQCSKNGKPIVETYFTNGVQNGLTKYYREDGSLHSEGQFKDGDRNGVWKYYDEQGKDYNTYEYKTEYVIEEAKIFLKLPNSDWSLTDKNEKDATQYIFKRDPIKDKNGRDIIPAIVIFVEDATKYKQDVEFYSISKLRYFKKLGVKIDETLVQENENYPLTYKNALFMKSSYTSEGLDHILYMIHIITKENKGVQIYLDMTKDLADDYESEFWTTIKSIREE